MATSTWRAVAAGATVVLGAGIGVVTNVLTGRWSFGLFALLAALVVVGAALQVMVTMVEGSGSGLSMRARATDNARVVQAGRDVSLGGESGDRARP